MKIGFEKQFGKGVDPWYAKAERWAKKQRFPISFLLLGFIDYLKKKWIDAKIYNTMANIDVQTELMRQKWEEDDSKQKPKIVETGVFGEQGWSISITENTIERGCSFPSSIVDPSSNAQRVEGDERNKGTSKG